MVIIFIIFIIMIMIIIVISIIIIIIIIIISECEQPSVGKRCPWGSDWVSDSDMDSSSSGSRRNTLDYLEID